MKYYLVIFLIFISSISIFSIAIYPRPFKNSDLSYLFEQKPQPLIFEYSGLFRGCKLNVKELSKDSYDSLKISDDFISSDYKDKFSPWISSTTSAYTELAYFHTLNFKECYDAFESEFHDIRITPILNGHEKNALIKTGGMIPFSKLPLSHANTIIILTRTKNNYLLITIKGGI